MKRLSAFSKFTRSNLRTFALIISLCTTTWCCDGALFDSPENVLQEVENDVHHRDFEAAQNRLEVANFSAKNQSLDVIAYNRAVVSILSGKCQDAQNALSEILAKIEKVTSDKAALPDAQRNPQETHFHALLHQALALAYLCPSRPFDPPSDDDFKNALESFYTAHLLGLDVRSQVTQTLLQWIPACESFIPDWQKKANTPDNALIGQDIKAPYLIACQEGVWIQFDARTHEKMTTSFVLTPLKRNVLLDDSQKLPFTKLHAEILGKPAKGQPFKPPLQQFIQPTPTQLPDKSQYQALNLTMPEFEFPYSGTFYIHLYTENHGEASVSFKTHKHSDCDYIDDSITYDESLKQKTPWLSLPQKITNLTLCTRRPDAFRFSLEPDQYALITLHHRSTTDEKNPFNLHIVDPQQNEVPLVEDLHIASRKGISSYLLYTHSDQFPHALPHDVTPQHILVHNATNHEEVYTLELALPTDSPVPFLDYDLEFVLSEPCDAKNPPKVVDLNLESLEYSNAFVLPTLWACPDQEIELQPILPEGREFMQFMNIAHIFSDIPFHDDDMTLRTTLAVPNDSQDYLVENGERIQTHWTPEAFNASYTFHAPITVDTRIKMTTASDYRGFINFFVNILPQEPPKKNTPKKGDDETQGNSSQNESDGSQPDKPSPIESSQKTQGSQTQGNQSTPSTPSRGNAAEVDDHPYEKQHIDALLDEIERGYFNTPLQGSFDKKAGDKPW